MTRLRTCARPSARGAGLVLGLAAATMVLVSGCNPTGTRPAASSTTAPQSTTASAAPSQGAGAATSASQSPPASTSAATPPSSGAAMSSTPSSSFPPGATTTVALPSTARACTIAITYGSIDATAGSTYRPVIFTNTADTACPLTGGARAEFLGADRQSVIGVSTAIDGGTIRLAPGESVTTTMRSTATGKFDEQRCAAEPVSGLRITPPADAAPTTLPSPVGDTVCNGVIRGQLSFTPLPIASEGP